MSSRFAAAAMILLLNALPAFAADAGPQPAGTVVTFFTALVGAQFSGVGKTLTVRSDGAIVDMSGTGTYGFSSPSANHWVEGFGICGNGQCGDGQAAFELKGSKLSVNGVPATIDSSSATVLKYHTTQNLSGDLFDTTVELELRGNAQLVVRETDRDHDTIEATSLFSGKR